jgi:hypothetical protein
MGKLFDSIKRRNGAGATPPRLQVVPAAEPIRHDDQESMPFYEVPATDGNEASTVSIAKPVPSKTVSSVTFQAVGAASKSEAKQHHTSVSFAPESPLHNRDDLEVDPSIVVLHQPETSRAQEFRDLAEHLARLATARQVQSMTFVPVENQPHLAMTVANLGCAWAEFTRHPVILIDAARTSTGQDLASLLGLGPAPGWEELMTGATLAETIQQTGRAWLDLIAAGRRLAWANTQAWAKRAGSVLESLSKHYRHILLLGPGYPHSPLGLVLAEASDSTCIIVPANQPNHPQKNPLLSAIAQQGGQVLGTIVLDHG